MESESKKRYASAAKESTSGGNASVKALAGSIGGFVDWYQVPAE